MGAGGSVPSDESAPIKPPRRGSVLAGRRSTLTTFRLWSHDFNVTQNVLKADRKEMEKQVEQSIIFMGAMKQKCQGIADADAAAYPTIAMDLEQIETAMELLVSLSTMAHEKGDKQAWNAHLEGLLSGVTTAPEQPQPVPGAPPMASAPAAGEEPSHVHEYLVKNFVSDADKHNMQHHMSKRTNSNRNRPQLKRENSSFDMKMKSKLFWSAELDQHDSRLRQFSEMILTDWTVDFFDLESLMGKPLQFCGHTILEHHNVEEVLDIDVHTLGKFLEEIEAGYLETNKYHNAVHGADVAHSVNQFVVHGLDVVSHMDPIDVIATIVSALVHDFKHPGVNAGWLKATRDDLAIIYNDLSPLENMHISETFLLMKKRPECNIFSQLNPAQFNQARFLMVQQVLATDMANHFADLADFRVDVLDGSDDTHDIKIKKLRMAIHIADISNPAKGSAVCLAWTDRIMEEFFQQGDKEKAAGMEVSPMCDREVGTKHDSQIGFINFIVKPAFESWMRLLPETALTQEIQRNLAANKGYWEQIKADYTAAGPAVGGAGGGAAGAAAGTPAPAGGAKEKEATAARATPPPAAEGS